MLETLIRLLPNTRAPPAETILNRITHNATTKGDSKRRRVDHADWKNCAEKRAKTYFWCWTKQDEDIHPQDE